MRNKNQVNSRIEKLNVFGSFEILSWIWHAFSSSETGLKLHSGVATVKEIWSHEETRKEFIALARKAMAMTDRKEKHAQAKP